ncbi:MAG: transketolase [Treponema sp.]
MKKALDAISLSIRSLSIDAIEKAASGHPGLPLGAAELATSLYAGILKHNPKNPTWINRDRFVLSAGHGSMLLYSILHIAGYDISIEDIKNFRQIGSKCQGHPEYGAACGVEMTTGPLGQGIATATGMAIAERMLSTTFNTEKHKIIDHYTYVLAGEGCLMEGISSESSSLAGSLGLNKLIVYYDANKISIDGSTDITFKEDVKKRYEAYGWNVLEGDMYSYYDIFHLTEKAHKSTKPTLIILNSIIGYGAPTVQNNAKAHGAPLGKDGVKEAKIRLGLDAGKEFYVCPEAYDFFTKRGKELAKEEKEWKSAFNAWAEENPDKKALFDFYFASSTASKKDIVTPLLAKLEGKKYEGAVATRAASKDVLSELIKLFPNIVGGSADLTGPNAVGVGLAPFNNDGGRYIHFGIREHAMAAVTNGIALHGGLIPFCATFLVFADYLRPSLRLSALMKMPAIYVFTHDSIFVGEDGATHQPIELLASLRAIPNLLVLRPGDAEETLLAWKMAMLNKTATTAIILSRQALPVHKKEDTNWEEAIKTGAYIVKEAKDGKPCVTILATGSEVSLALEAVKLAKNKDEVRVVSVISKEMFTSNGKLMKKLLAGRVITVEAGCRQGWEGFVQSGADNFSIECFGTSAPAKDVAKHLGFTAERLAKVIEG